MNKQEIAKLFNRIKNHYNTFTTGDEKIEEWHRFLKDYDVNEINDAFDEYISYGYENPPIMFSLTKRLSKIQPKEEDYWITSCDICGERITIYGDDMADYEKHRRKCSKIDFIDRMSKKFRGAGVALSKYYEMSDIDLDVAYHKIMNFYLQNKDKDEKEFLKEMPQEEMY